MDAGEYIGALHLTHNKAAECGDEPSAMRAEVPKSLQDGAPGELCVGRAVRYRTCAWRRPVLSELPLDADDGIPAAPHPVDNRTAVLPVRRGVRLQRALPRELELREVARDLHRQSAA